MNYLYKGNKRIKTALVKTKVDSSFIDAGASDILNGKISIDADYNEITGNMTITDSLSTLTSSATATAADIRAGQTGYKNGSKITGTATRANPSTVLNGIIESYKVANNNVISAGDFVKFVEEICGCGYQTTTKLNEETLITKLRTNNIFLHLISVNKILVFFRNDADGEIYGSIITITDGTITSTTPKPFSDLGNATIRKLVPIGNSQFVLFTTYRAALVTVSTDIVVDTSVSIGAGVIDDVVPIASDELFVISDESDGYNTMIKYSKVKLTNGQLVVTSDIPRNRELYTYGSLTACKISENKIMIAYAQENFNRASNVTIIDISNSAEINVGVPETLSPLITRSFSSVYIEDNLAAVAYYTGDSSGGIGYVKLVRADGLKAVNWGNPFSVNSTNIQNTTLTLMNSSLIILGYYSESSGKYHMIPITRNTEANNLIYNSIYEFDGSVWTYSHMIKIEDNKIMIVYNSYDIINYEYMIASKIVEVKDNTMTNVLTIYDMTKPLTQTMVALATGSDNIDGIADKTGIGRLYGGDTIDVIRPHV